tara:strand:+ start:118 stop:684 length:567 start_codon:yes stop_codon:yes gene_type:complete
MALTRLNTNAYGSTINLASNVTGTLATANGGTGATSFSPGKVLQTQSALFTSQSSHTTESYTATNYTDQITPSATNSKIFVLFNFRSHIYLSSGTAARSRLSVFRQINGGGYSQMFPNTADICWGIGVSSGERSLYSTPQISFLDTTHNTTDAIDYKLYARRDTSSTGTVNVGGSLHQAQVILMEISA